MENQFIMDLEAVNSMRKLQGMELLTELPKEGDATLTPEQIEAKRVADEAAKAEADKKNLNKGENTDPELSDEQLLKLLANKGITAASLEALRTPPPPADPVKVAEQREADELAYLLSKGLITKKEYDGFVSDSSDNQAFVYAQYHAEQKAEDPALTDEEIQAEFDLKYGLLEKPDSRQFKRGVKEINTLAEVYRKQKYSKIYDGKTAFSTYEKDTTTAKAEESKVLAAAPVYQKDVEEIFTELKKIPVKFSDTESIEVDAMEGSLDLFKAAVLKPDFIRKKILAGYTKAELKEEIFAGFLYKNFPAIAQQVANQHLQKHAAGTRGIPLLGGLLRKEDKGLEPNEAQKRLIALNKEAKEKEAATVK
jgi:hypothetical protein